MMQILDYKRRFQRGLTGPFESVPVVGLSFTMYGLEWCSKCEMEVDCDTQAVNKGTLYLYKRRCLRCGKVLKRGIYDKAQGSLPKCAFEWVTSPGKDRSK
jgi:hypothetical protein